MPFKKRGPAKKTPEESTEVKLCDYLCMRKCVFQNRLHFEGEVYTFPSDIETYGHFKKLGPHKVVTSLPAQVAVLREEVGSLKEQLTKVTAEKDNLVSKIKEV